MLALALILIGLLAIIWPLVLLAAEVMSRRVFDWGFRLSVHGSSMKFFSVVFLPTFAGIALVVAGIALI